MSEEVKRYQCVADGDIAFMATHPNGDYVRLSDYEALRVRYMNCLRVMSEMAIIDLEKYKESLK